jgi:hypothetical protein
MNSITDFMVYLWPVHYLWKVKLSLPKRIGLIVCFGVGVLYVKIALLEHRLC